MSLPSSEIMSYVSSHLLLLLNIETLCTLCHRDIFNCVNLSMLSKLKVQGPIQQLNKVRKYTVPHGHKTPS